MGMKKGEEMADLKDVARNIFVYYSRILDFEHFASYINFSLFPFSFGMKFLTLKANFWKEKGTIVYTNSELGNVLSAD